MCLYTKAPETQTEYAKQIGADYYAKDAAESARIAEEVFGQ